MLVCSAWRLLPKNTQHLLRAKCAKSPTEHKGGLVRIWSRGCLPTSSLDRIHSATHSPLDEPRAVATGEPDGVNRGGLYWEWSRSLTCQCSGEEQKEGKGWGKVKDGLV